jgi:hypothetical protein
MKRAFTSPDGVQWGVEARSPGASNIMVVFHYPDASTSRRNRYAWINWHGTEARNVTARLEEKKVLDTLTDADLSRLFRRSMPIAGVGPDVRNPSVKSRSN